MLPPTATPITVLAPGRKIKVEGYGECHVYPISVRSLKKYGEQVSQAIMTLIQIVLKPNLDVKMQLILGMVPWVLTNCLELVESCIRFDDKNVIFDDLPQWSVQPIVEAWLLENFDEEYKWVPWMAVAQKALSAVSGKTIEIRETLSKLASLLDTASETSSTAEPTTVLMKDGPSPNSDSGGKGPVVR
jgi:hypothetical protein